MICTVILLRQSQASVGRALEWTLVRHSPLTILVESRRRDGLRRRPRWCSRPSKTTACSDTALKSSRAQLAPMYRETSLSRIDFVSLPNVRSGNLLPKCKLPYHGIQSKRIFLCGIRWSHFKLDFSFVCLEQQLYWQKSQNLTSLLFWGFSGSQVFLGFLAKATEALIISSFRESSGRVVDYF